ncbi:hypothetical protein LINPERHAP2_LOCUS33468 [Linum perenne]
MLLLHCWGSSVAAMSASKWLSWPASDADCLI